MSLLEPSSVEDSLLGFSADHSLKLQETLEKPAVLRSNIFLVVYF